MSQKALNEAAPDPECLICHVRKSMHNSPNILHEFAEHGNPSLRTRSSGPSDSQQTPESSERKPQGPNQVRITESGGDPILRLVLMRKGIIEVADLDKVEEELRVAGKATFEPRDADNSGDR